MDTPNTPVNSTPETSASEVIPVESTPVTVTPFAEPKLPPPPKPSEFSSEDVETNKYVAALSYLGILVFIPLFLKRDSAYARKHSAQGTLLLIVWMIGMIVFWIPLIGWALGVFLIVVDIIALARCLQGEFWEIPVIGEYRKKLGLDDK